MNKKVYVDLSQQDVQDIINAYEKDIEKFNKQKEILHKIKEELFELKDMIYKSETREENFNVQRKISSMIVSIGKILEEIE